MKEHTKQIVINYRWTRTNGEEIIKDHIEALDESAQDRISVMMKGGYVAGELHDNIFMNYSDIENGEEGISYRGWWSITRS